MSIALLVDGYGCSLGGVLGEDGVYGAAMFLRYQPPMTVAALVR